MAKEKSFEDNMKRLEEIVKALEDPEISLEKGMALYKEGAQCSRLCREKLDKARHELEIWQNEVAVPVKSPDPENSIFDGNSNPSREDNLDDLPF